MSDTFEAVLDVRWGDIDGNGHLHNAAYLDYASQARVVFFQEKGFPFARLVRDGIGVGTVSVS